MNGWLLAGLIFAGVVVAYLGLVAWLNRVATRYVDGLSDDLDSWGRRDAP